LSVLIAILVFVSMWRSKSLLPSIPSPLVGLAVGAAVYYAMLVAGLGGHLGPIIGGAPSPDLTPPMFPRFVELARHPGSARSCRRSSAARWRSR
jgi:MFS superfamily sulfate permease-like transporter